MVPQYAVDLGKQNDKLLLAEFDKSWRRMNPVWYMIKYSSSTDGTDYFHKILQ